MYNEHIKTLLESYKMIIDKEFENLIESLGIKQGMLSYNDNGYINHYVKAMFELYLNHSIESLHEYIKNFLINND